MPPSLLQQSDTTRRFPNELYRRRPRWLMEIFKSDRYLQLNVHLISTSSRSVLHVPSSKTPVSFSSSPFSHIMLSHRSSAICFFLFPGYTRILLPPIALRIQLPVVEEYVTVTSTNFISSTRGREYYSGRGIERLGSQIIITNGYLIVTIIISISRKIYDISKLELKFYKFYKLKFFKDTFGIIFG